MSTILVADDNSNIQKMVALALKGEGIEVVGVSNGEAAVRKLPDVHPDLVLADVFMPVRNGYEVCEFVKNDPRFSSIPVILLVGAFDPLDEREADRVRADGVLKKPFVPPDPLITMVKSVLAKSAAAAPQAVQAEPVPVAVGAAVEQSAATVAAEPLRAPAPAETEEEAPEAFIVPPQRIEFDEGDRPLAFGDLLETPREESQLVAGTPHESEMAETKIWDLPETGTELETEPIAWRDSESALPEHEGAASFEPTDLTARAESLMDVAEPAATVSPEVPEALIQPGPQPAAELHVEAGPPPELASTPEEWLESAQSHPPAPLPIEAETPWTYAAPPEAGALPVVELEPHRVAPIEQEAAPMVETAAGEAGAALSAKSGAEEIAHEKAPLASLAAPEPSPADAGAHSYAATTADPRLVETLVAQIVGRLQPQILDIVTREILRPVVESLVRRELEKQ